MNPRTAFNALVAAATESIGNDPAARLVVFEAASYLALQLNLMPERDSAQRVVASLRAADEAQLQFQQLIAGGNQS